MALVHIAHVRPAACKLAVWNCAVAKMEESRTAATINNFFIKWYLEYKRFDFFSGREDQNHILNTLLYTAKLLLLASGGEWYCELKCSCDGVINILRSGKTIGRAVVSDNGAETVFV